MIFFLRGTAKNCIHCNFRSYYTVGVQEHTAGSRCMFKEKKETEVKANRHERVYIRLSFVLSRD
jgi:hypothetical protein